MKRVTILGSTGSIGRSALGVIRKFPDQFEVAALAAGRNAELLAEQIREFRPKMVGMFDEEACRVLRSRFPALKILPGAEGVREIAAFRETDFILSAIVGSAGLLPTIEAVKTGTTVGIANKESLVMAGDHVNALAAEHGTNIIPVDSEHSAIFQCVQGHDRTGICNLILTASGGPFVSRSREEMERISVSDALNHPNWSMGRKVTIDSATLMNKGLEVMEAHHLFGLDASRIKVLIHPQSIIHSMVEFADGSIIAQLSVPDMSGPIAYALSYPKRLPGILPHCPLSEISTLTFGEPDREKFPCLELAYRALREAGTMPAVLNAANEVAVEAFLGESITFGMIPAIIEKTMALHGTIHAPSLGDIIESDRWARETAERIITEKKR
ncbi:MAG: 1-deoxy-D-xylulose-5-phosphate reductoisomerase [bacterium]